MPKPLFPRRIALAPFAAAVAAVLVASPAPLRAQDGAHARAVDAQMPARVMRLARQDTGAFEFRRVWRQKTERIRANRVALERRLGPRLSISELKAAHASVTGTLRVPVLLGAYNGSSPTYTASQYQSRLFGPGGGGTYTVKSFYQEISRGAFTLDGTVTPWLTLPQSASYYDPSPYTDRYYGRTGEYLRDALNAADPSIDFGQYDNDGPDGIPNSGDDDGYVDVGTFVYPESGKACGGPGIWPHRWVYSGWWGAPYTTTDPSANGGFIKVDDYLILGGVACDGTSLMPIGTFSHEMGHGLGLPDLYDTWSNDGTGEGLGEWDLMSSGNYLGGEMKPAHMSAWSKDFLGWVNVETVAGPRPGYTLPPVYNAGTVLRYDVPSTREYFLLEHREATGSDAAIHGPGLLVYHVDQAVIDSTIGLNRVNGHARAGVALLQADGTDDLGNGYNRGDAGDPFPGTSLRSALGFGSRPSSNSNDRLASGLELGNISLSSGTLSFDLGIAAVLQAPGTVAVTTRSGSVASATLHLGSTVGAQQVQVSSLLSWITASPTALSTPGDVALRIDASGLPPGTWTGPLTLTAAGAANSPVTVNVVVTVTSPVLAVGDSATAAITAVGEADTLQLALNAGDRIDLGVWSGSSNTTFRPYMTVITPSGATTRSTLTRGSPYRGFLVGYTAPATGTYRVVVKDGTATLGYGGQPQPYTFRTRFAGTYLDVNAIIAGAYLPQGYGGTTQQGVTVTNRGNAPAAFTVTVDSAFLSANPSSAPVAAPAQASAADAGGAASGDTRLVDASGAPLPRPAGGPAGVSLNNGTAVTVQLGFTPGSRPQGMYVGAATFHLPHDVWNGDVTVPAYLRLHDPAAAVIDSTHPAYPGYTALAPDGTLAMETNRDIVRVDTATGAVTPWLTGIGTRMAQMQFGPDSLLYAADYDGKRVVRIERDNSVTTLLTAGSGVTAVAVLPDRTVYAAAGGTLLKLAPGSATPQPVLVTANVQLTLALAYKAGWLYYAGNGELRRFNVSTQGDEHVADLPAESNRLLLNLVVGAGGRLYGTENHTFGSILVFGDDGSIVDRVWAPGVGWGLSMGDHRLFGTGYFPTDKVWKMGVNDAAVPFTGFLVGDPNGDGRISSVDALGVLSYVVGKPLPAGWNMTVSGDANCDGQITAVDALVILSEIVQKDVSAFCVGRHR